MYKYLFIVAVLIVVAGGGFWIMKGKNPQSSSPTPATSNSKDAPSEIRVSPRAQMTREQAAKVVEVTLAPEVEKVLSTEEDALRQLLQDPVVLSETRAANESDKNLSPQQITVLDDTWIASKTTTAAIQRFMTNALAERLLAFQKDHPEFKEIFIADQYGLNAGETDKTSDFYQADEAWWVNGFNGGAGKTIHGKIEFDQSSQTEAISIYMPVMDGDAAIGVSKGVVDLSAIGAKL